MLNVAKAEEEMKRKLEEMEKMAEDLKKTEKQRKELEEQNVMLSRQKEDIALELQAKEDTISDAEERIEGLLNQKVEFEAQVCLTL